MANNLYPKLSADVDKTTNKNGSKEAVFHKKPNIMDIVPDKMTSEEKSLFFSCRTMGLDAIDVFRNVSVAEAFFMLGFGALLGFDTVGDVVFYWTEFTLALVGLVLAHMFWLNFADGETRALVAFLVYLLPRVIAPVVFMMLTRNEVLQQQYGFYVWAWIAITANTIYGFGVFYFVLRYYRQLAKIKAVNNFLKNQSAA